MSDYRIAPSILSADFAQLGADVAQVVEAGADLIHFDVMDNHYVPNLTFGPMVCAALRKYGISAPIDVHLMVEPVDALIAPFAKAGANWISFHPEASRHPHRTIQLIKSHDCQAGVALNPGSSLGLIEDLLSELDFVLLMSVNPGFGGQSFIPGVLDKVKRLKSAIQDQGLSTRIEIDGGVKVDNIRAIAAAGADTFVAGSAIFGQSDYAAVIHAMRAELAAV